MPKPFKELGLDEFLDVLELFPFKRRVDVVHVHHTFRPDHADFLSRDPIRSIEGMFEFHTRPKEEGGRGFIDIAQHITIDPRGIIWTGRNWDLPPASATGFNGNDRVGPFMFEMIGNFDRGKDEFKDPQRRAALHVIAAVQRRFALPPEAVRFHNQMADKTCPGSAINLSAIVEAVRSTHGELVSDPGTRKVTTFGEDSLARRESVRTIVDMMSTASRVTRGLAPDANEELPEDGAQGGAFGAAFRTAARGGRVFTAAENELLRKHVINLRFGAFSTDGTFQTEQADVDRIFTELLPKELDERKAGNQKLRLVFYAHGGLTGEVSALEAVLRRLEFWRDNGTYPLFFVWETGLRETIADIVKGLVTGRRGVLEELSDRVIEAVARDGGMAVWTQMKRSAAVSVLDGGGALEVARQTRKFWSQHHQDMEIHAAGHSAGAIFHGEFLPVLTAPLAGAPVPLQVTTLHLLAPAITVELFTKKLRKLVGSGKAVEALTMYTMNKSLEQDDSAGPYHKSLLYLVSRAFEAQQPTPILGLEESLRQDDSLSQFFGLGGAASGIGEVLFSQTNTSASPKSATRSTRHGDFDNDVPTMNSVIRRMIQAQDSDPIVSFNDETGARGLFDVDPFAAAVVPAPTPAPFPSPGPSMIISPATAASTGGARRALCVGIDDYPAPNQLGGCVHDATTWAQMLQAFGFAPTLLVNQQATRRDLLDGLGNLLGASRPGDVLVFVYAGHGTTVDDLDGDELDGKDEAMCPVDFASGALIIDDDLRALFTRTPAGVNLTCFMDCCHSGTITRVVAGLNPSNALPASTRKARFIRPNAATELAHEQFRRTQGSQRAVPLRDASAMNEVVFSACLPTEVAFEENGAGDFTTRATRLLGRGSDGITHAEFQRLVTREFGSPARQNPMLDCSEPAKLRVLFRPLS